MVVWGSSAESEASRAPSGVVSLICVSAVGSASEASRK